MNPGKFFESIWPFFMTKEDRYYYHLFVKNKKWNGATPNKDESHRWEVIREFLGKVQAASSGAQKILDVGSGRGWMTNLLTQYGTAEGLEPVASVVRYARNLFPSIVFHNDTIENFALSGNSYTVLVCTEVIEHVSDEEKPNFIHVLHSMLTAGGFLIITTPRKEILSTIPVQPGQPIEDWLSEGEVSRYFTEKYFQMVDKKTIQMEYFKENREVYQAWLFKKRD